MQYTSLLNLPHIHLTLERSLLILNSQIRHDATCTYAFCLYWLKMGYKTEFAFAQIPDVDCSDERAVCSTISQVIGSSLIWASIFFRLVSVTALVTHFTAMISPTYRTTFLHPASSSSRRVNMQINDST